MLAKRLLVSMIDRHPHRLFPQSKCGAQNQVFNELDNPYSRDVSFTWILWQDALMNGIDGIAARGVAEVLQLVGFELGITL
jgi:hypothetical protein